MKSPAFQIYVNDFLGSAKVGMMSTEEVGAYMLLLFLDWQEDGFVYDPKRLAKWCRLSPRSFARAWEQVGQCFTERDGRLYNPRLQAEREKQAAWREKAAKGAAITNEHRRNSARSSVRPSAEIASDERTLSERIQLPLPSSTPVTASSSSADDRTRLLDGLPDETMRLSWSSELNAAKDGMHGVPLTEAQISQACRDYVGNGHLKSPSLRHFRAFLKSAGQAVRPPTGPPLPPPPADDGAEAAWDAVLDLLPAWQRREIDAQAHSELPAGTRRGLSKIGGFPAILRTAPDKLVWLKKDFLKAFRASPATVPA